MSETQGSGPLAGKLALVTGASRGIGAATALALGKAGAHVVLTARTASALEKVEDAIHQAGGSATIAPVDLAEPDSIARLATAVAERWGKLDILVVNAGQLPQLTSVADIDPKAFTAAVQVNVLATQALIARFDPLLKKADAGRLVGLSTGIIDHPRAYWGAYASSKAAQDMLLEIYAQEVEKTSRVRVVILNPGATRTAMRARAYPGEDPMSLKTPEVVADRILALLGEDLPSPYRESLPK